MKRKLIKVRRLLMQVLLCTIESVAQPERTPISIQDSILDKRIVEYKVNFDEEGWYAVNE